MAESGMERGHRGYPGLLMSARTRLSAIFAICLISLCMPIPSVAQNGSPAELEEPLRLILRTAPDTLVPGGNLVVTILVDYPQAAEVSCVPPPIPWGLALRGVRSEPELISGMSGTERWTRLEYQFELKEAGTYYLGSFSIGAGGRNAETANLELAVFPASVAQAEPVLYWSGIPASFTAGTPFVLELRASGLVLQEDPAIEVDVPENALLENLKPEEGDARKNGSALVVARFRLTPLSAGQLRLPQASISTAGADRLRIRPTQLASVYRVGDTAANAADRRGGHSSLAQSIPETEPKNKKGIISEKPEYPVYGIPHFLPRSIRASADAAVSRSRLFWERQDYPAALAILRGAERDTLAGWILQPLRAGSEQVLGLPAAFDEPYAPRLPLMGLTFAALLFALMAVFLSLRKRFVGKSTDQASEHRLRQEKKESVTIFRSRGFFVASLCAFIALASFTRLAYAGFVAGQRVILSSCTAFRVPDPRSVQAAFFADGECVRSRSRAGSWLYVESVDGRAGWIDSGFARTY